MTLQITDTFTDLAGDPIVGYSGWIQPTAPYLYFDGTEWVSVSTAPIAVATHALGVWTLPPLPSPSQCVPVPTFRLRDPLGQITLEGPASEVDATATLHDLVATLGWKETT